MNSASRLLVIFDAVLAHPVATNVPAFNVWSTALGVDSAAPGMAEEGTLAIQAFLTELNSVEARLSVQGLPVNLYLSSFNRIRAAASQLAWGTDWRGMVGNVNTPDVRLPLAWAAAVLPQDEDEVSSVQLEALAAEFDQLSEALDEAELPPVMRAFAASQLRIIRAALRLYKVRGAVAVQEAVAQVYGLATMKKAAMAEEATATPPTPATRTFVQRMSGGFERVVKTFDSVDKVKKGGTALLEMGQGVVDVVGKFLQ